MESSLQIMTAEQVCNLAFKYAEKCRLRDNPPNYYYDDSATWFKEQGGSESDYSVFVDIVHMWTTNYNDVILSDMYASLEEWRNAQ